MFVALVDVFVVAVVSIFLVVFVVVHRCRGRVLVVVLFVLCC